MGRIWNLIRDFNLRIYNTLIPFWMIIYPGDAVPCYPLVLGWMSLFVCWGRFRTISRWSRCFQMWKRKIGTWLGLRSRNVAASPRGQGGMEVSAIRSGANMNSKKCSFIVKHWVGSLLRFSVLASSWKGSFFSDVMFLWVRQVYILVTFALFAIGQGFSEWNVISDSPARPTTLPGYVPEPIESVPWGPLPTVAEAL